MTKTSTLTKNQARDICYAPTALYLHESGVLESGATGEYRKLSKKEMARAKRLRTLITRKWDL